MKWIILFMFLIYVGTMLFLIYMRIKPALKKNEQESSEKEENAILDESDEKIQKYK